ncbi:zf-HC2 domain-containing protein [candidate division WOR-3 bacterium]|nr:zf-HC2 domain-containing protein [candidate division WOR-3 bacterium]
MKECKHFKKLLCDYLDGELSKEQCAEFEKHIDNCTNCDEIINNLKDIIDECKNQGTLTIPEHMKMSLKTYIKEKIQSKGE